MSKVNYKDAGVNIDAGNDAVNRIKENVKSTFTKNVLTGIGSFGSLFSLKTILKEYSNPVLVQSIDGVGTKTIIARKLQKYDTIGIDLLSACANDILAMGAKPLTFLDYISLLINIIKIKYNYKLKRNLKKSSSNKLIY